MKFFIIFGLIVSTILYKQTYAETSNSPHLMCYYEGASYYHEGLARLTINDLEPALQLCSHLIYGYADIMENKLVSNLEKLDMDFGNSLWRTVTGLKRKFPHLKVLLAVGGDKNAVDPENNKYLTILEENINHVTFVQSAHSVMKKYFFDGLELAWQFPKNKVTHVGNIWKGFKKDFIIDEKSELHKKQFTALVRELKTAFESAGYLLGLAVMPHVNSSLFFDVGGIIKNLDYVSLHTYDFQTPERNPEFADFSAPIYEMNGRDPECNVQHQVQHWLSQHTPTTKINIGVTSYGRVWKMTKDSGQTGKPPVAATDGFGPTGFYTRKPGLLSWPEICSMLPSRGHQHLTGTDGPWRKVDDPTKRAGTYAFCSADESDENGVWVSYEDPETVSNKAGFVKRKGLGGVALVDLSNDDFTGSCTGEKYPILRAIRRGL